MGNSPGWSLKVNDKYILEDKTPVAEPDPAKWGPWMRTANRKVREEVIGDAAPVRVITMFLGIDCSRGEGPPMLFESVVHGGPLNSESTLSGTWEAAEAAHEAMVTRVRLAEA